jgi:hypothetical protein
MVIRVYSYLYDNIQSFLKVIVSKSHSTSWKIYKQNSVIPDPKGQLGLDRSSRKWASRSIGTFSSDEVLASVMIHSDAKRRLDDPSSLTGLGHLPGEQEVRVRSPWRSPFSSFCLIILVTLLVLVYGSLMILTRGYFSIEIKSHGVWPLIRKLSAVSIVHENFILNCFSLSNSWRSTSAALDSRFTWKFKDYGHQQRGDTLWERLRQWRLPAPQDWNELEYSVCDRIWTYTALLVNNEMDVRVSKQRSTRKVFRKSCLEHTEKTMFST